jgi:hypothetical protein
VALHLRGEVRQVFMDWLRTQRPDLVSRYEELYRRGAYVPQAERERLSRIVRRAGTPTGFRPIQPSPSPPASGESLVALGRQDALF